MQIIESFEDEFYRYEVCEFINEHLLKKKQKKIQIIKNKIFLNLNFKVV